jgi:hypothetical protein
VSALWNDTRLSFVNEKLESNIDYAFHALSLHERRNRFSPELWISSGSTELKQCWFLGHHSDVGGGNPDAGLANISLLWMIAQLDTFTKLRFDMNNISKSIRPYEQLGEWLYKDSAWCPPSLNKTFVKYKGSKFLSCSCWYPMLTN